MEEGEPAYKKRGLPRSITINGNELFYKEPPLKNETYIYRCRKKQCKYYIKIDKGNLKKILEKQSDINYLEINKHTTHEEENVKSVENKENKEFRTEKETIDLAINLIKANITESLDFHINNFKQNKIYWKNSKIRKMLYTLREQKFPKEDLFINSIDHIRINLTENKDINEIFCPCRGEFINFRKKKRLEKYIIFMSEFQINYFIDIKEYFIDGTFKIAPKNWYQLLNIFGYDPTHKFYMPMAYIVLSSKSEELYDEVFYQIAKLIKTHTKINSFENIKIMCDFEIGLRKAIKKNFENALLDGCYFHYCKAIWKKIKKLKLFNKKLRLNTIILSFVMKAYPFIKDERREDYIKKMDIYANTLGGNYIQLLNYFKKYWKNCEIFNFTNINNHRIENRTNNICESFHHKLNKKISHYHPKLSFLVDGLKKVTKEYYDEYIKILSKVRKDAIPQNYIANDIFKFIKYFVTKSKENFDIDSLNQYLSNEGENFYKIIYQIIDVVSDSSDNVLDSIKNIFIENNLIKSNENGNERENEIINDENEEEEELEDAKEEMENVEKNNEKEEENNEILIKKDFKALYNGDVYIKEKMEERKKRKRQPSEIRNMLDELEIK